MGKCGGCRYWDTYIGPGMYDRNVTSEGELTREFVEQGYGACELMNTGHHVSGEVDDEFMVLAMYDGGYYGSVLTRRDFGCVLFEGKGQDMEAGKGYTEVGEWKYEEIEGPYGVVPVWTGPGTATSFEKPAGYVGGGSVNASEVGRGDEYEVRYVNEVRGTPDNILAKKKGEG